MIAVIPLMSRTFVVDGSTDFKHPIEGHVYYDLKSKQLYYYSTSVTRPTPMTGYLPIWNGTSIYSSKMAKEKYFDKDTKPILPEDISAKITEEVADDIKYRQRRALADDILKPQITDRDNSLTQCIKMVIQNKELTIVDLYDAAHGKLSEYQVDQLYSSLNKIALMRLSKFHVWCSIVLHVKYEIIVFKKKKQVLSYRYPENKYDTGVTNYSSIITKRMDCLKAIVRILMVSQGITKQDLKKNETDDYTVNNLMTSVYGNKPLSAQLFSRFIRLANLSYQIKMYDGKNNKSIFTFKE